MHVHDRFSHAILCVSSVVYTFTGGSLAYLAYILCGGKFSEPLRKSNPIISADHWSNSLRGKGDSKGVKLTRERLQRGGEIAGREARGGIQLGITHMDTL